MKLFTLSHEKTGWNQPWLPALDSPETLVVAFGTARLDEEGTALEELRRSYPRSAMVGCSTSGEIFGTKVRDDSLVVAVARFEKTRIQTACHKVTGIKDSREAGTELAKKLAAPDLRGVLLLADGLHVNGSDLVQGLSESLPHQAVVVGGLAGDGDRYHSTWVLVNRHPRPNNVCAVGFYGDSVRIHSGSNGSPDRFGPRRTPGTPSALPAASVPAPARSDSTTTTAVEERPMATTPAPGSAAPATLVRPVQLTRADRMVDGAQGAARITAIAEPYIGDVLSLAIIGIGRRITLGARAESETEAVFAAMPPKTQQIGFYSYGAIFPRPGGRGLDLHHSTMTVTSIGET
jgi:hypothetical protein